MDGRQNGTQNFIEKSGRGSKIVHDPETVVRAAKMLAGGITYEETARQLHVNRTTLWRWKKRKLFKKTFDKEKAYYEMERLKEEKRRYEELAERLLPLLHSPNAYIAQQAARQLLNSPYMKEVEKMILG